MPDATMLDSYHPNVAPAMWYIIAAPMQYRSTQNTTCIWLTTSAATPAEIPVGVRILEGP